MVPCDVKRVHPSYLWEYGMDVSDKGFSMVAELIDFQRMFRSDEAAGKSGLLACTHSRSAGLLSADAQQSTSFLKQPIAPSLPGSVFQTISEGLAASTPSSDLFVDNTAAMLATLPDGVQLPGTCS